MTVLLEAVSLVFENDVLESRYPGGLAGFRTAWDNGSFCTDGIVSRISFFETDDAFCTLLAMPDFGLMVSTQLAIDVAVFLHGGAPWVPCLWLEVNRERAGLVCWHVAAGKDNSVAVPRYFRNGTTLARYGDLDEQAIKNQLRREGEQGGISIFRDQSNNKLIFGPRSLSRH